MTYIPEDEILVKNEHFTAYNANYAKNTIAVHCEKDGSGFMTPVAFLARDLSMRYSGREESFMMSKSKFKKFIAAFNEWVAKPKINKR
jgi:hypothetical protein